MNNATNNIRKNEPKGIMVYCPVESGRLLPVGLELLSLGYKLARRLDEKLYAVILGANISASIEKLSKYAISEISYSDSELLRYYHSQLFTDVMEVIINSKRPKAMFIAATTQGRDLAAHVAARLDTGLTADCTHIDIDTSTGLLLQRRPAFDGNVIATIVSKKNKLQMATIRPGVYEICLPAAEKKSGPVKFSYPIRISNRSENKILIYKQQNLPQEDALLFNADIVVAAGRGVGNIQGLNLVKEFAESIKAPLCGSRGIVEDGLLPYSSQIGQTGKTIHPRLYIACGISGSAHHMSGVRADSIVAINKDPNAPIYEYADYGICGDIYDVLPKLIAGVRKSFPS